MKNGCLILDAYRVELGECFPVKTLQNSGETCCRCRSRFNRKQLIFSEPGVHSSVRHEIRCDWFGSGDYVYTPAQEREPAQPHTLCACGHLFFFSEKNF